MLKQVIVCLILITCLVNLGISAHTQNQPGPPPQTPGLIPPVYYDSLLNGLQILIVERSPQPDVTMGFMIKSGAAFDLVGREGATDLTARLVLRGTQTVNDRPLSQVFQEFNVGADVSVTWDATRFTFQAPTKNLPQVFPVIAEILSRSTFPEGDIVRAKQQRIAELQPHRPSPSTLADLEFSWLVFARHPYARPVEGTAPSLEAITPADIPRLHRRFYLANNAVLTIVGNVSAEALMPLIRPTFGALRRGKLVPATFTAPAKPTGIHIKVFDQPISSEAYIRLGSLAAPRGSEDFLPQVLLHHALTKANASPLKRLAETFSPPPVTLTSQLDSRGLAGSFSFSATTPNRIAPAVISSLLKLIESIRNEGITSSDLTAAKSYFVQTFPAQLHTSRQIVEQLQEIELYNLGRDYALTLDQRLERVTPEQIKKVATDFFSTTDLSIVFVGSSAEIMDELKKIGTVEMVK